MKQRLFLPVAICLSLVALIYPPSFIWGKNLIPYLLGVIMFGMGLTLQPVDFKQVWQNRKAVVIGVAVQYTIMPLLAVGLGILFHLPLPAMVGMILVGACPGGTASNVVCYIARANVALSVTLTICSTLLAPLLTPSIVYLLAHQTIDVPLLSMMKSVMIIVLIPVLLGLLLRVLLKERLETILDYLPSVSMLTIAFVIAVIMGLNQQAILSFPLLILLAVILHNIFGMLLGYWTGILLGMETRDARTLSIEIGMQNSGLGASLATTFFSAQAALPAALFSLWHNISGVTIARFWANQEAEQ